MKSRLQIFKGNTTSMIQKIISDHKIKGIFLNSDYTRFAQNREMEIGKL